VPVDVHDYGHDYVCVYDHDHDHVHDYVYVYDHVHAS
jgi:hypothetical protein